MTPIELEHRLTAALTARADQVSAADLRPPAPPTGQRRPNPHRWMLATMTLAAAVVSVAVFVVLGRVGGAPVRPSHQPPPVTSPTAPATQAPVASTPEPGTTAQAPVPVTPSSGPSEGSPEKSPPDVGPKAEATDLATDPAPSVVGASPAPTRPTPSTATPAAPPADPRPSVSVAP